MREASHWPDPADYDADTPADKIADFVATLTLQLPGHVQRAAFNTLMAGVIIKWVQSAAADGSLCALAGDTMSQKEKEWLVRVLAEVGDNSQPGLQAMCVDFALGLGVWGGISEEAIGEMHGVGKAAVSQRVVAIQEGWGLPKSRGMKSEEACQVFSARQTAKHREKPPRQPWAFAGLLKDVYAQPCAA